MRRQKVIHRKTSLPILISNTIPLRMEAYVQTTVIAIAGMIAMLSLIVGLEKMIRIIMGNYLISSILLWLSNLIELISSRLLVGATTERRVDIVETRLAKLLIAGKPTLLLTVYFILLIFITTKSEIGIGKIKHEGIRRILMLIFLPCTIISILLTLALAIFGNQIMNLTELKLLAASVTDNEMLYNFIMLTPLRVVLPGLVTFVIAAFFLRTKSNPLEIGEDEDEDEEDK